MFYFINTAVNDQKSGIEHAQIRRLKLFKKHHKKAQIITTNFNRDLHEVLKRADLKDHDVVNLFDFFQATQGLKKQSFTIEDLVIKPGLELLPNDQDENGYMIRDNRRIIQRIIMRAPKYRTIDSIMTFDQYGKLVKNEAFDSRGFKAMEQFYDGDGNLLMDQILAPDGTVVIQSAKRINDQKQIVDDAFRLPNYRGRSWVFSGKQALTRFFLDELNQNEQNTLIVDRTYEQAWAVLNMQTTAKRYMYLHSDHLNLPHDVMQASLNFNYEYALNNLHQWDGVLAATEQQKDDFVKRFGEQVSVHVIPVGMVSEKQLAATQLAIADRQANNVIMVARLSPEKQQDQLIRAFQAVRQAVSAAHLTLWGYANDHEDTRLKKLVADLNLEKVVKFAEYTDNISAVYDQAVLNVLTSNSEGFALSLLEGQSHGTPNVAYDVPYGPQAIIDNEQDGILVEPNNIKKLSSVIIRLLQNPAELQRLSDNSYAAAQRYGQKQVWQAWKDLFATQGD